MFAPSLPAVVLDSAVDPADRVSAIDFINRVNWLFDAWDIDAMLEAFLPDAVTFHTHGVSRGRIETRRLFQDQSPHVTPGISRQALNPIVDPDDDGGVIVRYHNLLVRNTAQASAPRIVSGHVVTAAVDAPEIFIYSAMTDRLRRTGHGWRIFERHVGETSMNEGRAADPYLETAAW
ncbi:nuclear transport factor 2 family protein [Candidatus Mycobacterium wuenschmannii]|uniref:Nuclear transport factor 2 family protein n=1 Tax=Candidatus Mycobacterium wuenschmannii TaxID=3027808 RepID=A0ABY8VTA6_9MYCO|nr:nuclear transport factor 2 family protein [Candidatus Mycobacterium wuenschmannii]WIM86848.1 nuclear transport factor 2 family protein [Candidatus Mycobacterium wuenschmannii]